MAGFPQGAIALVEPGHAHQAFLEAAKPRYAMLKYHHANRLLKLGETADSWFPDETTVVTTTNVIDHRNATIPLEGNGYRRGEIDIVREFGPDYHIPADRPDYLDYSDEKRYERTKECMVGTIAMANYIASEDLDVQLIPFVKTSTPAERELAYRTIDQLGLDFAAVYCNQYFNDGRGVLIDELLEDLEVVAREGEELLGRPLRLLTVSCLSPNVLDRAPAAVEAASGQMVGTDRGWRETIAPTRQTDGEVRDVYVDVEERVAAALPGATVDRDGVREADTATLEDGVDAAADPTGAQ